MRKTLDLTGKRFGKLTVIEPAGRNSSGNNLWLCDCDCGNQSRVKVSNLTCGFTLSCGCSNKQITSDYHKVDILGNIFGMLTVMERIGKDKYGKSTWECLCECGNNKIVSQGNLKSGNTISCGCSRESYISNFLKKYFEINYGAIKEYKILKSHKTKKYLPYDIYLPKENVYIEINGEQHYKICGWHKTKAYSKKTTPKEEFNNQKYRDKMKKKYAEENGTYVEVDLRKIKTKEQSLEYVLSKLN